MTKGAVKQELERVLRFLRSLEQGEKVAYLDDEAGQMRRKLDAVIKALPSLSD